MIVMTIEGLVSTHPVGDGVIHHFPQLRHALGERPTRVFSVAAQGWLKKKKNSSTILPSLVVKNLLQPLFLFICSKYDGFIFTKMRFLHGTYGTNVVLECFGKDLDPVRNLVFDSQIFEVTVQTGHPKRSA